MFTQMQGTSRSKPPSATDLVSQVFQKSDVNGDSALSADELSGISRDVFRK